MAVQGRNRETVDNSIDEEYLRDPDPHQHRVESFLKPLEPHWDLIRDVLLWKKPVHSLLVFVVVNGTFCYFATGNFRLFLLGSIIVGLSLCVEDVRSKVVVVLERAGITPEERESYEASLIYQRFCYKIALIWGFLELQVQKLKDLKDQSHQKYYAVLVVLFVVAAFAYQYVPWLKLFYCTFVFLYLWPPAKYHGTHRVIINVVEPFCKPFITHWRHSRTKREREQIIKAQKGVVDEEDSEEEFTKQYNPQVPKSNESAFKQGPLKKKDEQELPPPTIQSDHTSQLLIDLTEENQPHLDHEDTSLSQDVMRLDLPESSENTSSDLETPGESSVSLNSSSSFLPDSQDLPSMSMTTDHWEFDDDDFAQGLEFPDIDGKDYHSSNESLNSSEKKQNEEQSQFQSEQVNNKRQKPTISASEEQTSVADGSDFELLDKSEIDDMDPALNNERPGSSGSLGAMGKWLGL